MRHNRQQTTDNRQPGGPDRWIVSLVSLGCAKNMVDSERILGQFAEAGFLIAEDPADSDLCLVNTCGFIGDAREETAQTLRELSRLKARGRPRFIAALGCLVERAAEAPALESFLRGADFVVGFQDYLRLAEMCRAWLASRVSSPHPASSFFLFPSSLPVARPPRRPTSTSYAEFLRAPRLRIGPPHTAYLKISEGCSNPCRFCAIPHMRGKQASRPIAELVVEARQLVAGGARELNLIAQDTTSYGRDLYGAPRLAALLRALAAGVREDVWFRLLYAYPRSLSAEVLDVLGADPRFCPYIDLPLQHIADPILKRMGRGVTRLETLAQLDLISQKLPLAAIRTAFIAGYPGETERDFTELLDFVREGRFAHVGVFAYSPEPLTPAAASPDTVPAAEKHSRRQALLLAQREVSRARLKRRVGEIVDVLVDGPAPAVPGVPRGVRSAGRSQWEAPEVDGVVLLRGRAAQMPPGARLRTKIVGSGDYDLLGQA